MFITLCLCTFIGNREIKSQLNKSGWVWTNRDRHSMISFEKAEESVERECMSF